MEQDSAHQPIEELLPRYCEGLTDAEETKRVEEWLNENNDHQKIVNQLLSINLASDTLLALKQVDTEEAFAKIKHHIQKNKRIGWWKWAQRIAALLSIPLLIGITYQSFNKTIPELVQMIEIKTNPGMTTSVTLPDSTLVYLNSESTLRYPTKFTGMARKVELTGEAFFKVTKNKDKQFIILTPDLSQIKVYGTSFNVEAYEKDHCITTTLVEGSLGFIYHDKFNIPKQIKIQPNQKIILNTEKAEPRLYPTNCITETAWKDGKLIFHNTPILEAFYLISKRFNIEFVFKDEKRYQNYSFTGSFTNQHFERIMEYFKISSGIRWKYIESPNIKDEKQKIEVY